MNAYSTDLRARVIEYVEKGHTQKESAARFGVSDRTVWNWVKLKRETGSLKVEAVPRSPHKLPNEELVSYVRAHPDAYLKEIAEHFNCGVSSVHGALKRLGITYKKTPFVSRKKRRKTETIYKFCKDVSEKSVSLR
jgi:transposase